MPGNSGGGVFALAMAASERMFIISFPFKKQKKCCYVVAHIDIPNRPDRIMKAYVDVPIIPAGVSLRLVTMTQQSNQIELRENRLMSQSNHRISCV
jgi:hypothetical protein